MHSADIERRVVWFMDARRNLIVPNVSWGLQLHECDLLVVSKANNKAHEIEIKISASDLKADQKKKKWVAYGTLEDRRIFKFSYAVPEDLVELALQTPAHLGVLSVGATRKSVHWVRPAKPMVDHKALTEKEIDKLGHLAAMRIWDLKEANHTLSRQIQAQTRMLERIGRKNSSPTG